MKRREFIKYSSALGAGFVTSCGQPLTIGSNSHLTTGKNIILPKNPDAPTSLTEKSKSVLIIGGGIAGLSAAYTLVKKGFKVKLREAAPFLGGRLHTRQEKLSSGKFKVEHGLHMWFYQYYNFINILKELGVWEKNFRPFNEVFFTYKNYKEETIASSGPYPVNLINIVRSSPNLSLLNAAQTWRALPDLIFYNHFENFDKFDDITFYAWAQKTGVDKKFFDIIMKPAASVTLNTPSKVSASELIMNMHFYFIGHPKAFNRWVTTKDHGTAVVEPWARAITKHGGEINISSPAGALRFEADKCVGTIDSPENFDHVVVATDVPGVKKLMPRLKSDSAALAFLKNKLTGLKVAPRYHVLRVWLDQPLASKLRPEQAVIECSDHTPINLIAIFDMLEEESWAWAKQSGGSVVELHLYDTPGYANLSAREIWSSVNGQLVDAFSQTQAKHLAAMAKPIDFSLGRFENFTSFEPGQHSHKPAYNEAKKLGIEGLHFAGDWVNYDLAPNALMERAVTTGIETANTILLDEGVRQNEVFTSALRGPGAFPRFS